MNEAALLAARRNRDSVTMIDLFDAKDKVAMGPERKSMILTEKEKEVIAYHEAGHALVAFFMPEANPVEKVTIVPRGHSLGTTWFLPAERRNPAKETYEADIAVSMGGRAAEEIALGHITSGAKADIDGATKIARRMVCEWGMSERLGPISLGQGDEQVFLGREIVDRRHVSEETSEAIDEEIRRLVEAGRSKAHEVLTEHREVLDSLAMALLERETLEAEDVQLLVQGSPLPDPTSRAAKSNLPAPEDSSSPSVGENPAP